MEIVSLTPATVGPSRSKVACVLPGVLADFRPDLVLYDAGVDPHVDDALGRLALSDEGLLRRELQAPIPLCTPHASYSLMPRSPPVPLHALPCPQRMRVSAVQQILSRSPYRSLSAGKRQLKSVGRAFFSKRDELSRFPDGLLGARSERFCYGCQIVPLCMKPSA